MTATTPTAMFRRTAVVFLVMSVAGPCRAVDPVAAKSYGPSASNVNYPPYNNNNNNNYEIFRPLAVFTERPVNVADYVLVPVVQVSASDLRTVYRPQIDSVSKTEPIVMCKSSSAKSFEATPAVQVPLQQPFYMYGERTLIPFPKTVTILHGGYRVSIPVGVVVAPVPVGAFRAGPVFVTTLYAIPAGPLPPSPVPVGFVPWSSYPPNLPQYLPPPSYSQPSPTAPSHYLPPPPQYSQPAPAAPTYYQHGGDYSGEDANDLRNRDPPGKLYSQFAATAVPFQNSKESPLLQQLRQEAENNRNRYGPPSYTNQYQTVDA